MEITTKGQQFGGISTSSAVTCRICKVSVLRGKCNNWLNQAPSGASCQRTIKKNKSGPFVENLSGALHRCNKCPRDSVKATYQTYLQDIQIEMQMPPKCLQQDFETRCNSTYFRIKSLLEKKQVLCAYVADHDLLTALKANQKTMIILAPFEELTRDVSLFTSFIAYAVPAVTVLTGRRGWLWD